MLVSNLAVLRSENEALAMENQHLKNKIHQHAAEVQLLKTQLNNFKEKNIVTSVWKNAEI